MLFPKNKRVKDPKHLKRVAAMECCVCGWPDSDAHHIIGGKDSGMALKPDDTRTIPLCRACHNELHMMGHLTWETMHSVTQEDLLKRLKRQGKL